MSHRRSNLRRGEAFWWAFGENQRVQVINPTAPMNREQRRLLAKQEKKWKPTK
jgi:hypothetical protein